MDNGNGVKEDLLEQEEGCDFQKMFYSGKTSGDGTGVGYDGIDELVYEGNMKVSAENTQNGAKISFQFPILETNKLSNDGTQIVEGGENEVTNILNGKQGENTQ